jgi:hypothetical protein
MSILIGSTRHKVYVIRKGKKAEQGQKKEGWKTKEKDRKSKLKKRDINENGKKEVLLIFEDGTDRLSRNVGTELPLDVV